MITPFEALAAVPDELTAAEAAPLLCAGITTFNALRNSGLRAGDVVAILGMGGLGHLGVQFAAKMGCRTVAIARGRTSSDRQRNWAPTATSTATRKTWRAELAKLGGARVVLATVTESQGHERNDWRIGRGRQADRRRRVIRADRSFAAGADCRRRSIQGWPSGTSIDSEDTLAFSALADIRPMIETMPLERAAEAYERMMSGAARFRMVLTTGL